jgi:hypothetical protein
MDYDDTDIAGARNVGDVESVGEATPAEVRVRAREATAVLLLSAVMLWAAYLAGWL